MSTDETCRLCALKLPSHYLKDLKQLSDENLDQLIWQFLQIKMETDDKDLPSTACNDCCKIVLKFNSFYVDVQNAQEKFRNFSSRDDMKIEIKLDGEEDEKSSNYENYNNMKLEKSNQSTSSDFNDDLFQYDDIKTELVDYDNSDGLFDDFADFGQATQNAKKEVKLSWLEKRKMDLKCYKCESIFPNPSSLEEHFQNVHDSKPEYVCTECRALFQSIDEFKAHLTEHGTLQKKRGFKIYKCEICDKEFNEKTNFTAHQYTHSGIKRFECELCGKRFTLKQHMEIHKYNVCLKKSLAQESGQTKSKPEKSKKMSRKKRKRNISDSGKEEEANNESDLITSKRQIKWKCYKCDLFFPSSNDLQKHFDKFHNGESEFVCVICLENFKILDDYESHLSTEHSIGKNVKKPKKCNICNKVFNHKTNFDAHQLIHTGIKNFACDVCGKRFALKQHLEGHKITHLKANVTYDCDQCDRKYKTMHLLQVHLKIHLRQAETECVVCGKRFNSLEAVKRHKKKVHDEIEEFICEQCGKHFRTKYNLDVHVKTHTTETPYTCDECFRAFKSPLLLRRHKTVHTGIKPYSCEFCGKSFRLVAVLNKHKITHTDELPFECDYCKKSFRTKENLKIHYRQHTGEKPYSCTECNHHFTNDSNFIKHLKGRHGLKNFSIANNHQYPFLN